MSSGAVLGSSATTDGRESPADVAAPIVRPPSRRSLRRTQVTAAEDSGTAAAPSARRPLVAITSRAPVVQDGDGWRTAPGGLAPIVRSALDKRGGAWISWNSNDTAPPRRVEGMDFEILTFTLGREHGDHFYSGYANRTLWPLLHDMAAQPVFDPKWWPAYRHANAAFARAAVLSEPRAGRDAVVLDP